MVVFIVYYRSICWNLPWKNKSNHHTQLNNNVLCNYFMINLMGWGYINIFAFISLLDFIFLIHSFTLLYLTFIPSLYMIWDKGGTKVGQLWDNYGTTSIRWWTGTVPCSAFHVSCLKSFNANEQTSTRSTVECLFNQENTFVYFVQRKVCLKDKYSTNIPYYRKRRVRRRYFYFYSAKQAGIDS